MLNLGADMSFGGLDQILEPSIWRIRQAAAFARPHRHSEFSFRAVHRGPFGDALVASVAVDDLLITMQQIGSWREVVHVGSRDGDRVDQA